MDYPRPQTRTYSEKTASQIDDAVRELVEHAFERATAILKHNRKLLDETAQKLLEKETLSSEQLPKPSALDEEAVVA